MTKERIWRIIDILYGFAISGITLGVLGILFCFLPDDPPSVYRTPLYLFIGSTLFFLLLFIIDNIFFKGKIFKP